MPRGIQNWTFKEVEKFLFSYNFQYKYSNGSHRYYYGSINKSIKIVTVPFHGKNKSIKPKTMSSIIKQSGIKKENWLNN